MAYFINTNKHRGYLKNNLNVEMQNRKSLMVPEILKGFQYNSIKPGDSINIKNNFNLMNIQDQYLEEEIVEEKRFWMNLINPSKNEMEIVDKIKLNLKYIETAIIIFSMLTIIISQFEYELVYYETCYVMNKPDEYTGLPARIVYSIISLILSYYSCYLNFLIKREQKKIISRNFWGSYYYTKFFWESLMHIIHPIPGVDFEFTMKILGQTITYRFQTFLYALQFLKIYNLLRLIPTFSKYTSSVSEKYCDYHGGESDLTFCLKCIQKDKPFHLISISAVIIILVLGILLRMFEILNIEGGGNLDYYFYSNGIWNILVAITTVGYGDFYPKTHIGRIIVVIGVFLGTFLTSLTIVALQKASSFDKVELQAFTILRRILIRKELKIILIRILQVNSRIFLMKKNSLLKRILLQIPKYMDLIRKRKYLSVTRMEMMREINKENFTSDEDKFLELEPRIDNEIYSIKENLKHINDFVKMFEVQLDEQRKFIKKLDNTLEATKKTMKTYFYKLFIKRNKNPLAASNDSSMISNISFKNKDEINSKNIFRENLPFLSVFTKDKNNEFSLSQIFKKTKDNESSDPNFLETFLTNNINEEHEVINEEFDWADPRSKELVNNKSKKTVELLKNLQKIKEKNTIITNKLKEEKVKKKKANETFFENTTNEHCPSKHKIKKRIIKKNKQKNKKMKANITHINLEKVDNSFQSLNDETVIKEINNKKEDKSSIDNKTKQSYKKH